MCNFSGNAIKTLYIIIIWKNERSILVWTLSFQTSSGTSSECPIFCDEQKEGLEKGHKIYPVTCKATPIMDLAVRVG